MLPIKIDYNIYMQLYNWQWEFYISFYSYIQCQIFRIHCNCNLIFQSLMIQFPSVLSQWNLPGNISEGRSEYILQKVKEEGQKLKQDFGLEITEGKKAMSKNMYNFLAKTMFHSREAEHIFPHLFLLLDWWFFNSWLIYQY